jgi:hypothetical protein
VHTQKALPHPLSGILAKDFVKACPANGAFPPQGRAAILHRHPLGIFYLSFLFALNTVSRVGHFYLSNLH